MAFGKPGTGELLRAEVAKARRLARKRSKPKVKKTRKRKKAKRKRA